MENIPDKDTAQKNQDISQLMGSTSKRIEKRRSLQIPDAHITPRVIIPSTSDDYNEVARAASLKDIFQKYQQENQPDQSEQK